MTSQACPSPLTGGAADAATLYYRGGDGHRLVAVVPPLHHQSRADRPDPAGTDGRRRHSHAVARPPSAGTGRGSPCPPRRASVTLPPNPASHPRPRACHRRDLRPGTVKRAGIDLYCPDADRVQSPGCRMPSARAQVIWSNDAVVIWSSDAVANPGAAPAPGKTRSAGGDTPGASHSHDQLPENDNGARYRRQGVSAGQMACAPRARFERAAYCLGAIRAMTL
jgi:hypothetical protein